MTLCEDAEFEFVACHVKERMFRAQDLTEEGVIKFVDPRPWDTYEGEFYWKK